MGHVVKPSSRGGRRACGSEPGTGGPAARQAADVSNGCSSAAPPTPSQAGSRSRVAQLGRGAAGAGPTQRGHTRRRPDLRPGNRFCGLRLALPWSVPARPAATAGLTGGGVPPDHDCESGHVAEARGEQSGARRGLGRRGGAAGSAISLGRSRRRRSRGEVGPT